MNSPTTTPRSTSTVLKRVAILPAALAIVGLLAATVIAIMMSLPHAKATTDEPEKKNGDVAESVVNLTADKLRVAQLHVAACQVRELSEFRTVPGKVTYNEAHHWEVKTPVGGVVKHVFVTREQLVKKGDPLATVNSRDIGLARDEVAKCKADLAIVKTQAQWAEQVAVNVGNLLAFLKQHPASADVEKNFDQKLLGEHREKILGAYSKLILAEELVKGTRPLENTGAISARVIQEHRSDREVVAAAFQSACEQSQFEAAQARDKSLADVQHAERLLAISHQRLESLGAAPADVHDGSGDALSELVLRAPFDGVIAERSVVDAAQVPAGQTLFVLADTATVWVTAELHERDWNDLATAQRYDLLVRAPSLKEGKAVARVKFTEGRISPETRTVSLVGELENPLGQFRPGMFVWVSVAVEKPRPVLAVPAGAILRHEQVSFVFVAEGPEAFRRVDVTPGLETPDYVEIKSGLTAGQQVVDQGAFYLKSELLLEREAD